MESLEKVCSQCYVSLLSSHHRLYLRYCLLTAHLTLHLRALQDLIHQVRRAQAQGSASSAASPRSGPTSPPSSWGAAGGETAKSSLSIQSFETVLKSFEAKKK